MSQYVDVITIPILILVMPRLMESNPGLTVNVNVRNYYNWIFTVNEKLT